MFAEVVGNGGLPLHDRDLEGRKVPGVRSYARQILLGLAYCHKRSIAHRDIKLENLLLSADKQTCKIADFGLAKVTTGGADMTILGTIRHVLAFSSERFLLQKASDSSVQMVLPARGALEQICTAAGSILEC